jgi:hypothetical protein
MISKIRKVFTSSQPSLNFIKFFAIFLVSTVLINITYVLPSEGLTRYYNCIARVANKNATLTISNVDNCYNLVFKGALDYYGIKQQPHTINDNSSDLHQSNEKHNPSEAIDHQTGKLQKKTQSADIFR